MSETYSSDNEATAIREASAWYARLTSGMANKQDQQQWLSWHAASSANQHAWQTIEAVCQQLGRVPGNIVAPTLTAAAVSRRNVLRSVAALFMTGSSAWISYRVMPWQNWSADYRTATGERHEMLLADGSQLFINTSSTVDVVFDAHKRLIRLHAGEILIQTAQDPQAIFPQATFAQAVSRPFTVETSHGEVLALGTRFSIRTDAESSFVSVLEKSVRIQPSQSKQNIVLAEGQQLSFTAQNLGEVQRYNPLATSWTSGSLTVIDMPLAQLVKELARYRPGILICSEKIADLKVSGTFPIDDTDRALTALAHGYQLNILSRTRYWIKLEPA